MTDEMFIARAREEAIRFGRLSRKGLDLSTFPKVRLRRAVVVYFESEDEEAGRVEVYLDGETGTFIRGGYRPCFDAT